MNSPLSKLISSSFLVMVGVSFYTSLSWGAQTTRNQPPKTAAGIPTAASVAVDIAKVEKVAEAIKKLDEGMANAMRAREAGKPMDNMGLNVLKHYSDHTGQWLRCVSAAKSALKAGNLKQVSLSIGLLAEIEYDDTWRYIQTTQLKTKPTPWDEPFLAYQVALLRLTGGLLGKQIPDPITPGFLGIQVNPPIRK